MYRHADLVLQKLQAHPDRNKPENRKALNAATAAVSRDLKKLEEIAPRIKKRHDEYEERRRRQRHALKSLEGEGARVLPHELDGLSLQDRGTKRPSYDSRPTIDARALENQSLAARLAQREVRRRDTNRMKVRQYGVSEEEEQARRSGGAWDRWQDELAQQADDGDHISNQIQEVARLQQNGNKTSYSSVGKDHVSFLYILTSIASVVPVHILISLPDRSIQDVPGEVGLFARSRTSATSQGADILILGVTSITATAASQVCPIHTRRTI